MIGARIRLLALVVVSGVLAGWGGAPGSAGAAAAVRSVPVSLSPAPSDLSLVAIRFPRSRAAPLGARSLRVRASGPFGSDLLALAVPRRGAARLALLLLANRPSALLDPASVHLRVLSSEALGAPLLLRRGDPLSRPVEHPSKALCALATHGAPLRGASLRTLSSRGAPLAGFSTASAVAEAYDAACGLPYAPAFRQALAGTGASCPGGSSCAPAPEPAPPPVQPPGPPGCTPCEPTPGIACPLSAHEAVCVAGKDETAPSAGAGAH